MPSTIGHWPGESPTRSNPLSGNGRPPRYRKICTALCPGPRLSCRSRIIGPIETHQKLDQPPNPSGIAIGDTAWHRGKSTAAAAFRPCRSPRSGEPGKTDQQPPRRAARSRTRIHRLRRPAQGRSCKRRRHRAAPRPSPSRTGLELRPLAHRHRRAAWPSACGKPPGCPRTGIAASMPYRRMRLERQPSHARAEIEAQVEESCPPRPGPLAGYSGRYRRPCRMKPENGGRPPTFPRSRRAGE